MSDSFWAVFGCGALFGMIATIAIIGLTRSEHEKHYIDTDMRIYIPSRDRDRSGDIGCDKRLEAEEREIRERAERMNIKIGG